MPPCKDSRFKLVITRTVILFSRCGYVQLLRLSPSKNKFKRLVHCFFSEKVIDVEPRFVKQYKLYFWKVCKRCRFIIINVFNLEEILLSNEILWLSNLICFYCRFRVFNTFSYIVTAMHIFNTFTHYSYAHTIDCIALLVHTRTVETSTSTEHNNKSLRPCKSISTLKE